MASHALAIRRAGLVTSVGLDAPSSCAAFRAKITNPSETPVIDANGEWVMAHAVQGLPVVSHGLPKLAQMAAMAISEALVDMPKVQWAQVPMILCVAEPDRPGRTPGLDELLLGQIESELGGRFAASSAVVSQGRAGVAVALMHARRLISQGQAQAVLVAATDSLLPGATLSHYEAHDRLLTSANSDGFMPGEAGGALLLSAPSGGPGELLCTGIGFGTESAHIQSGQPLRADGLSAAIKAALADAGCEMHDMDFRITDNSGEQYYFKEASLALSRTLRVLKTEFDIWHPAECTGEIGATSGITLLAAALAASQKRYAKGQTILAHLSDDAGRRAALVLQYPQQP